MIGGNLIKISKEDLKSSIVLYENKNYTQALFCFHQAVEKATKYLALSCGVTEDDFKKKIKHDGIKLFSKIFKNIQNQNDLIPSFYDSNFLDDLERIKIEFKLLSDQEIVSSLLKQIASIYATPYPIPIQDMSKPLQLVVGYMIKLGVTHELIVKPFTESEYVYMEKILGISALKTIATVNLTSKIGPLLFMLIVFTNRYKVDDFRYPNSNINDPINYFTIENPYVAELMKFFPILEDTIIYIEKMVNINSY